MVAAHIWITGEVQGVFFRRSAKAEADKLGITGWVRNKRDGSVETLAEGEKGKVEKYIKWCRKGSPLAKIENVEVEWKTRLEEFDDFEIL